MTKFYVYHEDAYFRFMNFEQFFAYEPRWSPYLGINGRHDSSYYNYGPFLFSSRPVTR